MPKGISRIHIPPEALESGQITRLPSLLNGCEVYGVLANNEEVTLSALITESSLSRSAELQKKGYLYSGVKWVYGRVNTLDKEGILWGKWYYDTNKNRRKDEDEQWVENKPLTEISGSDLYGVNDAYKIANTISVKFEEENNFQPSFFWVEPFLIHPELHFSQKPKGIFIIPMLPGNAKIYRTQISCEHSLSDRFLYIKLPGEPQVAEKNDHILYYDEQAVFTVYTLFMPQQASLSIEITEERTETERSGFLWLNTEEKKRHVTLYRGTTRVKPAEDLLWINVYDERLLNYLLPYLGEAEIPIVLSRDKKPEEQGINQDRTFHVTVRHSYTALTAPGKTYDEIYPPVNGYITIAYGDENTRLERQNKEADQFVIKLEPPLLEPGNDPCHYTKINVQKYKAYDTERLSEKDGSLITLFDEEKLTGKHPEIALIAGDKKPAYLKISADLHTRGQCRPEQHTAGEHSVFYFPGELSANRQHLVELSIAYDSISLQASYQYIRDTRLLNTVTAFPFNYFWLTADDVQKHILMVETCRYKTPVRINIYPDIEWDLTLKVGSVQPEVYSHTNMPASNGTFKTHQDKSIEAGQNRKWLNREVFFELSGKGKTGNTEVQISVGYEAKIRSILKILVSVKETLDELCHVTEAKKGMAKSISQQLPGKLAKLPITFQLDYPVISISGNWKWGYNPKQEKEIIRQGKFSLGFTPLIKGTGKIDLIACAEFIPPARGVIKAAKWTAKQLGSEIWFNLYASGEINLKGNIYLGQEEKVEPFDCNTTVTIGVELGAKVSTDLESIVFEAETVFEAELSAKGETSITLGAKRGIDVKGVYTEMYADFGGVVAYVTAKVKVWDGSLGIENKAYTLVKPKPDLIKKKYYIVE